MPFLLALLKINIVLSASYLLYRFFLRKLTFFNLNRAFLIGSFLVAALAPFLSFTISRQPAITWIDIVQTAYWAGAILMAVLLLFRLSSLYALFRNSNRTLSTLKSSLRNVHTANKARLVRALFVSVII